MMVLMASDSMARGYKASRPPQAPRPLGPLRPLRPFMEELGQLQRVCDVFADESSVAKACQNIKGNVETFQSKYEEDAKTFMNEQTSNLEDVLISVCKAMNDADYKATGYEKMKNKQCKKLVIPKRYGGILYNYRDIMFEKKCIVYFYHHSYIILFI